MRPSVLRNLATSDLDCPTLFVLGKTGRSPGQTGEDNDAAKVLPPNASRKVVVTTVAGLGAFPPPVHAGASVADEVGCCCCCVGAVGPPVLVTLEEAVERAVESHGVVPVAATNAPQEPQLLAALLTGAAQLGQGEMLGARSASAAASAAAILARSSFSCGLTNSTSASITLT